MSFSNVYAATIGVSDLDRASDFYRVGLGYEVRSEGSTDDGGRSLWRIPDGIDARYRLLAAPNTVTGALCLLECAAPGESIWGDYSSKQDLGHYAVNYLVRDIQQVWGRLQAAGARTKFEPTHWVLEGFLAAWDSQCLDPDGAIVDAYELDPGFEDLWGSVDGEVSEIATMAVHVADAERSIVFYRSVGLQVVYDHVLPISQLLGLAADARVRNINMNNPAWGKQGRVELVQYVGAEGRSVAPRAVPPNHGLLSITITTDDLDAAVASAVAGGGSVVAGPIPDWNSPYGRCAGVVVTGPDGEAVELVELRSR